MHRRQLLKAGAMGFTAAALCRLQSYADAPQPSAPVFRTENARWQAAYDKAMAILAGNIQVMPHIDRPVLIEGAQYAGIWQECGPYESLVYRRMRPDVARNSHMTFFELQRTDGQLPANNKRVETGFGQIQMVVPIAATAWELAEATRDSELLERAYESCSRWDAWLMRFRNTRKTGLVEGFCTYDTGMDNSPRWAGLARQCPGKDAKVCPDSPSLPRLCPDLSATVYGARVALASMANALGKQNEADQWTASAASLRTLILDRLYDSEDAAFYDRDAQDKFVKIRTDILSRMCGEHVVDQALFDLLWTRQLSDPHAFWAPFPFPSVALDDPQFVRPIPPNSWGGAAQCLTALRSSRWMDHYGRSAEFAHLMMQWCEALQRDMTFRQQVDPLTGEFTQGDKPGYSPACLLMYDFTWRLAGIHEAKDEVHWNVRPGCAASEGAVFRIRLDSGKVASMTYSSGGAELVLDGQALGRVRGSARLVTDSTGRALYALGVERTPQRAEITLRAKPTKQLMLQPNKREVFP